MLTVGLSDGLVDGSLTCINFVGRQLAVLAGDFLLARASVALASLRNTEVCTFSFGQWTVGCGGNMPTTQPLFKVDLVALLKAHLLDSRFSCYYDVPTCRL